MSSNIASRLNELIEKCIEVVARTLGDNDALVQIRLAEPIFGKSYTTRYKVDLATLDVSGINLSNKRCVVVGIPSNDINLGYIIPSTPCDSIKDKTSTELD